MPTPSQPTGRCLLRDLEIVADEWVVASGDELPHADGAILPIETWQAHAETLRQRGQRWGIAVDGTTEPEAIAPYLDDVQVVSIDFPAFVDGRGLSLGHLLRTRFGFEGELRAVGALIPDSILYASRCGFNAAVFASARDAEAAQRVNGIIDAHYQASAIEPRPLFRRAI